MHLSSKFNAMGNFYIQIHHTKIKKKNVQNLSNSQINFYRSIFPFPTHFVFKSIFQNFYQYCYIFRPKLYINNCDNPSKNIHIYIYFSFHIMIQNSCPQNQSENWTLQIFKSNRTFHRKPKKKKMRTSVNSIKKKENHIDIRNRAHFRATYYPDIP